MNFFEDPEMLIGWPLIVLGAVGMLIAVGAMVAYWIKPS